jgi:hypothetical protein
LSPYLNPVTHGIWQVTYFNSYWRILKIKITYQRFKKLKMFSYFIQNPYSGTLTRTREPVCTVIVYSWPVLGNFDPYSGTCPYSGTLKLTCTRLCTKDPEYNTLKNPSYFVFCLINVLNIISMLIIDALLLCHVSWVIGFESGLKKIDFSKR